MQLAVLITMLLISVLGMHQFIVQPLAPSPEPPCVGQPRMVEDAAIDEQELAALGKGGHCGRRQRYAVTRKQQRFIHRGSEAPHIYYCWPVVAHTRAQMRGWATADTSTVAGQAATGTGPARKEAGGV